MQRFLDSVLALLVRALFAVLRALGPDRASALGGFLARNIGPLLPVQRTTLDNIARAFPEKPPEEHRRIAREAWDNLGRTACEYVHMDRIWDFDEANPNTGRIQLSPETVARFMELRGDGKPGLFFAAHLANWELPAIAAAAHGLDSAVLYRMPNNAAIGRLIVRLRAGSMGRLIPTNISAPVRMLEALDEGLHVGMLVDQRFSRGPRIAFFGRETPTNPLLPRLARRFDCPVHGARAIRLDGARFRLELTEPINLPRDAKGEVDIEAATAAITRIVEGWIRDYPGQWLWMHRRWR
ncbi:lipid A biosynthesis lauroyl acyltransferase [Siccirubricoccus sp. KC 17139]|uniref:Lipid A biosynthesis lauroyl acyltransferase n=1 Tax=Siccirubricoccus soli TaxID=2899147 RepID=A0ABT1CYZ1_9PROT|nr:lipid A biosynthesis lauroyl acyltransferase [Siccirubricoccus soli]MCO6414888.1 lipid A biosynthesis lauroyl acyltransferase [Siccirubricoccus soli]MCP2681018.1 lipid A biosynthesis lauroyl acyltransferase [Siccirubricoccus soli]